MSFEDTSQPFSSVQHPNNHQLNGAGANYSPSVANPLLEGALDWARRGFPVLPLWWPKEDGTCACGTDCGKNACKHPLSSLAPNGVYNATQDENIISKWWELYPEANIGIAMGNGFLAVDIDIKNGANGLETFLEMLNLYFNTLTHRTPSGGFHAIYKTPEDFRNQVHDPRLPGIDIRSLGAYIVAPPSRTAEGPYLVEVGGEAEPLHSILKSMLQPPAGAQSNEVFANLDGEASIHQFTQIAKSYPASVQGRGGNNNLFALAAKACREYALSPETAIEILYEHFNPRCVPPWGEYECGNFEGTIRNGAEYGRSAIGEKSPERFFESIRLPVEALPACPQNGETAPAVTTEGQAETPADAAPEGASEGPDGDLKADQLVEKMNQQFALIKDRGGKAVILRETIGPDGEPVRKFQSIRDFHACEANQFVRTVTPGKVKTGEDGKEVKEEDKVSCKPASKYWQEHRKRRTYESLVFDPKADPVIYGYDPSGVPKGNGYLNMWQGFAVKPKAGDWSLMQRHITEVIAANNLDYAKYIFKWVAWCLQNPGKVAEVALVLRSGEGTGKGIFARALRDIFGKYGAHIRQPEQIVGRFNGHLEYICYMFVDEAFWAGDKKAQGALYGMITEPTSMYEHKGFTPYSGANMAKGVFASNHKRVVPAGQDARRWAVFDVSEARKGDWKYLNALRHELANGGLEAMLHDSLELDLQGWHPRQDVPQTEALRDQKELSLDAPERWLLGMLEDGELPGGRVMASLEPGKNRLHAPMVTLKNTATATVLLESLIASAPSHRHLTKMTVSNLLKAWGCVKDRNASTRFYTFPALPEIRAAWCKRYGERSWPEPAVDWDGEPMKPLESATILKMPESRGA